MKFATSAAGEVLEKQIRVPDSWLRGFLQVQSSASLPRERFALAPIDLYNALRHLRMHADRKGPASRAQDRARSPANPPRLVLEPWNEVIPADERILTRARGRGSSGSGAVAACCSCRGSCRSPRRSRSTYPRQRPAQLLGPPKLRDVAHARPHRLHRRQLVAGAQLRPAPAPQGRGDDEAARRWSSPSSAGSWSAGAWRAGQGDRPRHGPRLLEALQLGCQQGQIMYDLANDCLPLPSR